VEASSGGTFSNTNTTIKGTGTIVGAGTSIGSGVGIQPGASPGTLSVTGDLNLGTSTYTCEINGTTPGSQHDVLAISGAATLTSASLVVDWGSYTPAGGETFDIMTFGSRMGTFASVTIPPVAGVNFTVSYTATKVTLNALLLPVELVDFSASPNENGVLLKWKTASELNADRFEIEHSTDGLRFAKIGERQAAGTTTTEQHYDFLHENPAAGVVNYYRLRQMDFDGKEEFSEVVAIDLLALGALTGLGLRAYPNPVSGGELTIVLPENLEGETPVHLFDAAGRLLRSAVLGGGANVLDVRGLAAGGYWLRAGRFFEKIVVD
jgi:hypothetical protein